jgi:hypothetical protein
VEKLRQLLLRKLGLLLDPGHVAQCSYPQHS